MYVSLDYRVMSFLRYGKKLKLISDGGDSVSKKLKKEIMVPMVRSGGVCVWLEPGVCQSVLFRCLWQKFDFSHRGDFSTLIHYMK
jgi:hypothetical protein